MKLITILSATLLLSISSQAAVESFTNKSLTIESATIESSLSLREQWLPLTRDLMLQPAWSGEGDRFHYKLSVDGGFKFFQASVADATAVDAFDHHSLATALSKASGADISALALPFEQFRYRNAGQQIQFYYAEQSWQCDLTPANCRVISNNSQPKAFGVVRDLRVAADNTPKQSPDGRYQALVTEHNLLIQDHNGQQLFLSSDGQSSDFYDPESIQWAPDSSALVVMRVIPGKQRLITRLLAAPADQLEPKVINQLYPKPGDAVDIEQPVLVRLADNKAVAIANDLFATSYWLDSLAWQQDSSAFSFRYTERGHQRMRLIRVDAGTAAATAVVTEDSKTFVNMWAAFYHPLQQGGQGMIWLSEQDGWAHLYHTDGSGQQIKQLTKGNWRVRRVLAVDEHSDQIWFTASGYYLEQDPYFEQLFRIGLDGSDLTPLTQRNANHDVALSPDKQHYIVRYSRVDLPYVAELRRSSDNALLRQLARADISKLTAAGFSPPEPFVAKGRDGSTDIWGLIVKPQHFDPARRYPVIENIYAGPHDSFVPKSFWPFGFHSGGDKVIGMQALADLGFIVVQIDGMGTANRSKAFHDVAWQDLVDSGFADRILWHQAAAQHFAWYQIDQGIGIYGASAGGQSTVAALLFHPQLYKVGVAYAGCYDNRMDKISWNEQWLGYPVGPQYAASSVVEQAHLLQGRLLIINGEQDSNVDPASSMQLVDALIRADKDFDLLLVPGGEHSVGRSSGPIRYIQRRQFDFFLRHLQQIATTDWNQAR